jgi:hypothetical protein
MSQLVFHLHHHIVSPLLHSKHSPTSLYLPQFIINRTFGGPPGPYRVTLDVSRRVTQGSPVLVPLKYEEEQETEAAAESSSEMPIPLDRLFIPPGVEASQLNTAKRLEGSNIVISPYAYDAQIEQAEFIKSSSRVEECPMNGYPEFALVGRSNVGKSSLVNSLVRRKQLAMTSKKPGRLRDSESQMIPCTFCFF